MSLSAEYVGGEVKSTKWGSSPATYGDVAHRSSLALAGSLYFNLSGPSMLEFACI